MAGAPIQTKGVQGAPLFINEFFSTVDQMAIQPALDKYKDVAVNIMRNEAPVLTGFMRSRVTERRVNAQTIQLDALAYYSGFVNYGYGSNRAKGPRPFFTDEVDRAMQGNSILTPLIVSQVQNYMQTLINKYQNGP